MSGDPPVIHIGLHQIFDIYGSFTHGIWFLGFYSSFASSESNLPSYNKPKLCSERANTSLCRKKILSFPLRRLASIASTITE